MTYPQEREGDKCDIIQELLEQDEQELQDKLDDIEDQLAQQDNNVSSAPVWGQEEPEPEPSTPSTPSTSSTPGSGTDDGTTGDDDTDDSGSDSTRSYTMSLTDESVIAGNGILLAYQGDGGDVTIGNSVTSIGDSAFVYCNSLTNVYYGGSEADRKSIGIGIENSYVENAWWHYNSTEEGYSLDKGMLVRTLTTALADDSTHPFTDVTDTTWYSEAVQYVYEYGLMQGTGDTTFASDSPTSWGMIVTILHRLEGLPDADEGAFPDVPE